MQRRRRAQRAHRCKERSASSPYHRQGANALQPRIKRFTSALQAAFTPTALCPPRPSAHSQTPPPARNSSTQHVLERLRLRALPRSTTSNPPSVPPAQSPQGTSPLPVSPHLAARTAAPLICTPLCANPPPPPPTPLLSAVHATPARAPRAVARRRGGSAPARCDGAVGGGLRMLSQRLLAATELTRACTSFLCLRRLSCCSRLRGAPRARSAALRAPPHACDPAVRPLRACTLRVDGALTVVGVGWRSRVPRCVALGRVGAGWAEDAWKLPQCTRPDGP